MRPKVSTVAERNEARVRAALARWEAKLARAKRAVAKLKPKVRRYERLARKRATPDGACQCCAGQGNHGFKPEHLQRGEERFPCLACKGTGWYPERVEPCRYNLTQFL